MSGLPHTIVSSSNPVKTESSGTGTTLAMPSLTAAATASNSCSRKLSARLTYSPRFSAVTREYLLEEEILCYCASLSLLAFIP